MANATLRYQQALPITYYLLPITYSLFPANYFVISNSPLYK
jgi:hypothetical protein